MTIDKLWVLTFVGAYLIGGLAILQPFDTWMSRQRVESGEMTVDGKRYIITPADVASGDQASVRNLNVAQ